MECNNVLTTYAWLIVIFVLLIPVSLVIYRLFLHPLRKFPGPKLASCTYLYENYYEIYKKGQYTFKLQELHEKYGPVVRLNPNELHFNDPDFYNEIYNTPATTVEKAQFFNDAFGPIKMTFTTVDHHLHHTWRGALKQHFTKRSISKITPYLHDRIEALCRRFQEESKKDQPINIQNAFAALTRDVISQYCFAESSDTLSSPDFDALSHDGLEAFLKLFHLALQFPIIMSIFLILPVTLQKRLSPGCEKIFSDLQTLRSYMCGGSGLAGPPELAADSSKEFNSQIEAIKSSDSKPRDGKPSESMSGDTSTRTSILRSIIHSDLPLNEKRNLRLQGEAFSLIVGSTTTVAHTLAIMLYHLLANPSIYATLFTELQTVIPGKDEFPAQIALEQSPYLTAVILEGLRHSTGLAHRLWRSYPSKTLHYNGVTIPPRTIISATALLIHQNPTIFPDPHVFKPERWLGENKHHLRHYMVAFSKGTRSCLGMNLAYTEMYFTLAVIIRRFQLQLHDVVRERDVDPVRDAFIPLPKPDSKGIRIKIVGLVA